MDKKEFKFIIRECIEEFLQESLKKKGSNFPKVRKSWGDLNPVTRIHGQGKQGHKPKYNRKHDNWKKDLDENEEQSPLYVEYHSQRQGETPFVIDGTKYEFVNAKYPNGKIDIGVYSFAEDLVYSYDVFRQRHNIKEGEESFYQDAKDYEDLAAEARRDLETVEKAGLGKEYDSLMNGIFNLPIAEFDKRSEQLKLLLQKAYQITGGNVSEGKRVCAWCQKDLGGNISGDKDTHGICPACKEKMMKDVSKNPEKNVNDLKEMTTTGAVQGFLGKNWCDPDPNRKKMKNIAVKSVGGKIA